YRPPPCGERPYSQFSVARPALFVRRIFVPAAVDHLLQHRQLMAMGARCAPSRLCRPHRFRAEYRTGIRNPMAYGEKSLEAPATWSTEARAISCGALGAALRLYTNRCVLCVSGTPRCCWQNSALHLLAGHRGSFPLKRVSQPSSNASNRSPGGDGLATSRVSPSGPSLHVGAIVRLGGRPGRPNRNQL